MGCGNSTAMNSTGKKLKILPEIIVDPNNFIATNSKPFQDVYKIGRLLGSGSFGDVRIVTHKETGDHRAVKIFKKDLANTDGMKKMLVDELNILRTLDHPSIIRIFEFFENDKKYYIVMEHCEGGELFEEILKKEYFDENVAASILHQLFSAVAYLHSKRIVHRDLKPENILLEDKNDLLNLKLVDFGHATRLNPGSRIRVPVGSSYYIAPEVLKGSYTEKCDLWSCGVITYMLLSGKPPFDGKSDDEIIEKVKKCSYHFKDEVWKSVSNEAKDLIFKLLALPDVRISAQEALEDPWLQRRVKKENLSKKIVTHALDNLKGFSKNNKLKEAVNSFIATQCLTVAENKELRNVFKEMDGNGDGKLSRKELIDYFIREMGEDEAQNEVNRIFAQVDTDNNGYVEYTEFLKASLDGKTRNNKGYLKRAFDMFDKDGSGTITIEELRKILAGGSVSSDGIWAQIIQDVDKNGDGVIDLQEFESLLMSKIS
jgi:calcium-dependent protein kinase